MIPAPSTDIFMQQWVVTVEFKEDGPIELRVSATGSRLAILMAGMELVGRADRGVPVSVEIIEAR